MVECKLRDGRSLSKQEEPYFVAELNTSHYGKLDLAKEMIDQAKWAGCDCVKFQSWSEESLYSKTYYEENPFAKRMIKRFVFQPEQLKILADYCKQKEIAFSSTPYCEQEVDFLVDACQVPYIKIASMDLNNKPFLTYIAKKQVPIILSTGMSTLEEIKQAVCTLKQSGTKDLCLLHCISIYPPKLKTIRLKNILGLKEQFPDVVIGFSDHSIGREMAIAATALGSVMIEKHLTLDKSKIGMDNQMATEPKEMKEMIDSCKNVFLAMGTKERIVEEDEKLQKEKMRRSLILKHDLNAGDFIEENNLAAKRPGTGLSLDYYDTIIGKSVNKEIKADYVLKKEDINW